MDTGREWVEMLMGAINRRSATVERVADAIHSQGYDRLTANRLAWETVQEFAQSEHKEMGYTVGSTRVVLRRA